MNIYLKLLLKAFVCIGIIIITLLVFWGLKLTQQIKDISENGWFPPATEVFALGETLHRGAFLNQSELNEILMSSNFRADKELKINFSFSEIARNECLFNTQSINDNAPLFDVDLLQTCYILKLKDDDKKLIGISISGHILFLLDNEQLTDQITLPSYSIAHFDSKGRAFLHNKVQLPEVPLQCLQALTAVEDKNFLTHRGISPKGILRAILKNIQAGRKTEGASTITQQLVKNYFLSHRRTYERKAKEIFISILLETIVSKDEILENYLNVIYLGQSDSNQIIGYGSASEFYFQKNISDLNLQECALLAAIVNSPGRFNPFKKPENAIARREKVLNHLLTDKIINENEFKQANASPLPKSAKYSATKSSFYYLDAIKKESQRLNLSPENGLKIYTSISPLRQRHAQQTVTKVLKQIESQKKLDEKNITLQASLINVDIKTGHIKSLIGGRDFRQTQFNRTLNSKRQVGSLMKPFVYITALENKDEQGKAYNALSTLTDQLQTFKYEGQTWSPKNYSRSYQDRVPFYYALKNSLNAPTADLGMSLGVKSVIELSKRLGITTELKPFPSLFLGALELSQTELLQAYTNIANFGVRTQNTFIQKVTDQFDNVLYEHKPDSSPQQLIARAISSQINSILQQTALSGTARSLKTWRKFSHPIAGKTGTTNNTKDSWFIGYTPDTLTLVWVGNDQNKSTGLTGSSGALPIWSEYMKKTLKLFPVENNFPSEQSLEEVNLNPTDIEKLIPNAKDHEFTEIKLLLPKNYEFTF